MNKAIKRIAVMALALVLMCCGAGTVTVDADGDPTVSQNTSLGEFVTKDEFQPYRNANAERMIGVSGDFGLMAFDTLTLNQHTDSNFAANKLNCTQTTGTNDNGAEVNFVMDSKDSTFSSNIGTGDDYLYIGSGATIGEQDGHPTINGTKLDHMTNDMVVESDNFLHLDKIKTDIQTRQNNFLKAQNGQNKGTTADVFTVNKQDQATTTVTVNPGSDTAYFTLQVDTSSASQEQVWNNQTQQNETKTVYKKFNLIDENNHVTSIDGGNNSNLIFNLIKDNNNQYKTVVVNIDGSQLGNSVLVEMPNIWTAFDGEKESAHERGKNGEPFDSHVILNFANFSNKAINMNITTATTLATGATVNLQQNHDGTCVADNINVNAEFHRNDIVSPTANLTVTKTFSSNVTTKPKSVKVAIFNKKFLPNDFKDGDSIFNDNGTLKAIPFDVKDIDTSGNDSYTTTFTGLNPSETYIVYEIAYTKTDGTVVPTTGKALNFTNQSKNQTVNVSARTSEFTSTTSAVDKTNANNWIETIGNSSKGTYGANRTRKQWTVNKTFAETDKAENVKSITVQLFKYDSQGNKEAVKNSQDKNITEPITINEKNGTYSGSLTYNNSSLPDLNEGEYYRFDEVRYTTKSPEKTVEIGSDDSEFTANVNDPNPTSDNSIETITNNDAAEITVRKVVKSGDGTTLNTNDIPTSVTFNIYRNENGQKTFVKSVALTDFTQNNTSVTKTIKGLPAGDYTAEEDGYTTIGENYVNIEDSKKYTTTSETSTDANGKKTVTVTNRTQPSIIKTGIRTTTDAVGLAVILASAGLVIALAIRSKMLNRA